MLNEDGGLFLSYHSRPDWKSCVNRINMIRLTSHFDTIMIQISQKYNKLLKIILKSGPTQSSALHAEVVKNGTEISLVTIKRELSVMAKNGLLYVEGSGRSVRYYITSLGRIFAKIDAEKYCQSDPDKRYGLDRYNFDLLQNFPTSVFSKNELNNLVYKTNEYQNKISNISTVLQKKELERLIIELSWKSSKIEGNTYTLIDTEKLILKNEEARGHNKKEAKMILNHKKAFDFIRAHINEFKTINRANLEKLHGILVEDMDVNKGLRSGLVGVTGSKYKPLELKYQIQEAVDALIKAIAKAGDPYTKALIAILGISYIQPFEDGNKRTSRLMGNALLLANGCSPLSYRSVEEEEYREAILVFYELNSIESFKNIFITQYIFACDTYAIKI